MRQNALPAWVLLVGIFLTGGSACRADDLPADLDAVPRDAAGFVHVRAAELWRSDWAKDLRFLVDRAGPQTWKDFEKTCPINPSIVERVTLIYLTPKSLNNPFPSVDPEAMSALVLVTTNKPFDHIPLVEALGSKEKVYRRHLYYFNEELWSGLAVIDERTFIIGSEEALVHFFDMSRHKTRTGPLDAALTEAVGKHQIVVGLNPALLGKIDGLEFMPPPLRKLLEAHCAILTLDLDDSIRFKTRLDYPGENQARDGETAVRQSIDLARLGLTQGMGELEKVLRDPSKSGAANLPENFAAVVGLGFLRELDTLLKDAPVKRQGSSVNVLLTHQRFANASLMGASVFLMGLSASSRSYAFAEPFEKRDDKKDPVEEHLRTLAKAFEKYRDKHGAYPPAAIRDREGRPVLSWRVAILPYLGEESLYKEFRLDEPWDSLHNKRLLKKLPKALKIVHVNGGGDDDDIDFYYYRNPTRWKTTTLAITGANTVFEGEGTQGVKPKDVARPVILLARLANHAGVYWTKPADVAYDADQPLPDFYGKFGTKIKVMLTNGTYRSIDKSMNDKAVRALIERTAIRPPKTLIPPQTGDLQAIWHDFTQHDEAGTKKAWQGIKAMSKTPERAVPFVKEHAKPAPVPDPKRIAQYLADLDSNNFQKRVKAATELERLGPLAQPAIDKKLLDKSFSLEARRRLEGLAQKTKTVLSGEELRSLRAVAVLEEIGTPAAWEVLRDLSRGGEGAVLTEQARRALARLAQR